VKFSRISRLFSLTVLGLLAFSPKLSAQETKQIRFAVTSPPHFLPIWLAADNKIFSKHGLDVDVIFMRGGALITMGILSGELQLSGVGAESVVAARTEGGDVALLACPLDLDYVYLITRPEIKSPAQLKGKASAVSRLGSTTHFYLRSAFKQLGMDVDKELTILQLGAGPEIAVALETGRISAAALSYRNALVFLERGWPVLVDLTKTELKYPPSCVASSRAFVRRNPNTIDRFLKGYIEAIHVIKKDVELAKRIYAKRYRESDPAVTDKVVRAYAGLFKSVPTVPESGLEVVIRDLASRRPLSKELLQPDAYKDDGPLQKIVAEGWIQKLANR
jgi:NitT/TauT family transport system substrate-binding protein